MKKRFSYSDMHVKLGFLLFDGFPMACLTSVIEPLRAANEISGQDVFSWQLISETGARVISSAQLGFECETSLHKGGEELDYLIVLSAPLFEFEIPQTPARIRRLARHGLVVGAISGGVFPLAHSGVALPSKISVHWCYAAAFAAKFPSVDQGDDVLHITPTCVTASGAAAAFDLSLHLIESALGAAVAQEVACWFQHPKMRSLGVKQTVPKAYEKENAHVGHDIVDRAVAFYSRDLSDPKSITEIAQVLNISPRHLERSFKSATGLNPSGYFRRLRMKSARQVVLYTNDAVADVAAAVGYINPAAFCKQYRHHFGCSPHEDRQRINSFRVESNRPLPSI